ncbi:MAG: CxxC motif-containing protein (DUF1111 family) [Candidatus Pelagisphaera sp.]|jgi:CxxC motif-containing protein (DUF1111 family)
MNPFRIWALFALGCSSLVADPGLPGGATTSFEHSRESFTQPASNLDPRSFAQFFSGDTIFNTNWVNAASVVNGRDGLGPLFNTRSCSACHFKDGRGLPPEKGEIPNGLLIRISLPGSDENAAPRAHPIYGNQISVRALPGLLPEATIEISYKEIVGNYPDGSEYRIQQPEYRIDNWGYGEPDSSLLTSPRVAPSVFGLGLLDAIPNEIILAQADPNDYNGDGISGRPNWVKSPSKGDRQLGKYGWKANKATIEDQTAGAFQGDLGITSTLFPGENHSPTQADSLAFPSGGSPELIARDLEDIVFYLKTLAPSASRFKDDSAYSTGHRLFTQSQCSSCHTPDFETGSQNEIHALANQRIYPYTDLLLHDMGDQLADNRPDFEANGNEWRTPPLWGLGLTQKVNGHSRLLHDGRARNTEEAILWHGGEAESSKQTFMKLSANQRKILIDFVEAL